MGVPANCVLLGDRSTAAPTVRFSVTDQSAPPVKNVTALLFSPNWLRVAAGVRPCKVRLAPALSIQSSPALKLALRKSLKTPERGLASVAWVELTRIWFVTLSARAAAATARKVSAMARRIPSTRGPYSHSMVAGGLLLTSRTTRLIPRTSLVIRLELLATRSQGRRAQSAVMPSRLSTARSTQADS